MNFARYTPYENIEYFRNLDVSVQELDLNLDDTLLSQLIQFVRINADSYKSSPLHRSSRTPRYFSSCVSDFFDRISSFALKPPVDLNIKKVYFETLNIEMMKINLSFVSTTDDELDSYLLEISWKLPFFLTIVVC